MGKVASRSEPEFCIISISTLGVELSEAMGSIGPRTHERAQSNRFRGNAGENIKGMGRDNVREVRDHSNAVPGIGGIIGGRVSRRGSVRKSRGRFRT